MIDAAAEDKRLSAERTYSLRDLRAVPEDQTIRLAGPKGTADLTHWSFGQVSRMIGAPAGYLRQLPPTLGADCLNHGFATVPASDAVLLVKAANGNPRPTIRAATSQTYGRIWDADLYRAISETIMGHDPAWRTPPTWSGEPAGAYRGDRDSFLILCNGGSIVEDPSARGRATNPDGSDSGTMYRGIIVRNSETGGTSVWIETFLFRTICGNHLIAGFLSDRSFRRRHTGRERAFRDSIREISRVAYQWTRASAERDTAIIRQLIDRRIGVSEAAVIAELRKLGAAEAQAKAAYLTAQQTERIDPSTYWAIAQGLTRNAQETQYQDERYQLDRLAGALLSRGRQLVAAA